MAAQKQSVQTLAKPPRPQPREFFKQFLLSQGGAWQRFVTARTHYNIEEFKREAASFHEELSLWRFSAWVVAKFMQKSTLKEQWIYTRSHSREVAKLSLMIAAKLEELGCIDREKQPELAWDVLLVSAFAHDIGKLPIPRLLLRKEEPKKILGFKFRRGPPVEWERALLRDHVEFARWIMQAFKIEKMDFLMKNIYAHHERFDGRTDCRFPGYPKGLSGEAIPLGARIIKVADTFSAMVHHRFYRNTAFTPEDTIAKMVELCGSEFDPLAVKALIGAIYDIPADALDALMQKAGTKFDSTPRAVLLRGVTDLRESDVQQQLEELGMQGMNFRKAIAVINEETIWELIKRLDVKYDIASMKEFSRYINSRNRGNWSSFAETLEKQSAREDAANAKKIYHELLQLDNLALDPKEIIS